MEMETKDSGTVQTELVVETASKPDSICWAKAKDIFLEALLSEKKKPSQENINRFLNDNFRLDKAISKCESLKLSADNQYKKSTGSRFVGKLLSILVTVKEIGDPFMQCAPESVSIAWSAVSFLIQVGANDLENCGLIAEACAAIATVILNCRLYENRYTEASKDEAGDQDTEKEIMNSIPPLLALVLEFSWFVQHRLGENKFLRSFKETFNPKLKEKYQELLDEYKKLRSIANDAFQEQVMDMMDELSKRDRELQNMLFPALSEISSKLDDITDIKQILTDSQLRDRFVSYRESLYPSDIHTHQLNVVLKPFSHDTDKLCHWLFEDDEYIRWETSTRKTLALPENPERKGSDAEALKEYSNSEEEDNECEEDIPPRICYIKARPGFGKSVTVACALTRLSITEKKNVVCYFFFKKGDDATQLARQALLSLAAQLFSEAVAKTKTEMELFNDVMLKYRRTAEADVDGTEADRSSVESAVSGRVVYSNSLLKALVKELGKVYGKNIYFVVDAIDECQDYENEEFVEWLLDLARDENSRFKVLISSRDNLELERVISSDFADEDEEEEEEGEDDDEEGDDGEQEDEQSIDTGNREDDGETAEEGEEDGEDNEANEDEQEDGVAESWQVYDAIVMQVTEKTNATDMETYLRSSLKKLISRWTVVQGASSNKVNLSRIVDRIKEKANGMFTYSAMVIASLGQPSPLSLAERLRRLPDGMDELYRRRLESLTLEERKLVTLALKRIVWGFGDVGTVEIAEEFKQVYQRPAEEDNDLDFFDGTDDEDEDAWEDEGETEEGVEGEEGEAEDGEEEGDEGEATTPASDAAPESEPEAAQEPWEDALALATLNPDITDIIYHLEQAGRDFFQLSGDKIIIDVIHKSVRDWVENESKRAAERDTNMVSLNSLFVWDEADRTLKLSLPVPNNFMPTQNTAIDFQSERETHLDFTLYIFKVLNSKTFQDAYMPPATPSDFKPPETTEEVQALKEEIAAKEADLNQRLGHLSKEKRDAEKKKSSKHNGYVEGPFSEDEDDSEMEEDSIFGDGTQTEIDPLFQSRDFIALRLGQINSSQSHMRYEMVQWGQHLRHLEDLFEVSERKGQKWESLWREITDFFTKNTSEEGSGLQETSFRRWFRQYWVYTLEPGVVRAYEETGGIPVFRPMDIVTYWGLAMVMEFLIVNLKEDPNEVDAEGDRPILDAYMHPKIVELLVKHGVDIHFKGSMKRSALQLAMSDPEVTRTPIDLENQGVRNVIQSAKLLIKAGADINDASNMIKGRPPFHTAVVTGDQELFDAFMDNEDPKLEVNQTDFKGQTALHKVFIDCSSASQADRVGMAKRLIEAGADVNAQDTNSVMPLTIAVLEQNLEGVDLLLENGADIHDEDIMGVQAIHEASDPRLYEEDEVAIAILDKLVAKGADLKAITKNGKSTLERALRSGHVALFRAVVEHIVKIDGDDRSFLMRQNFYGENLLHILPSLIGRRPKQTYEIISEHLSKEQLITLLKQSTLEMSRTPIQEAADWSEHELVDIWRDIEVDYLHLDADGNNLLGILFRRWRVDSLLASQGSWRIKKDEKEGHEAFLKIFHAEPKAIEGREAVMLRGAIVEGSNDAIKALADYGVDPLAADKDQWTVLDWAVAYGQTASMREHFGVNVENYLQDVYKPKEFEMPTRLNSQHKSELLELSEDGLSIKQPNQPMEPTDETDPADGAVAYANVPISPKAPFFYFEAKFTFENPQNTYVVLGLVGYACPVDRMPGLRSGDVIREGLGFHCDEGRCYHTRDPSTGGTDLPGHNSGTSLTTGDVVGLGWNRVTKEVFLTKNGEFITVAWRDVRGKLWPAIGGYTIWEAKLNFGGEEFEWKGYQAAKEEAYKAAEKAGGGIIPSE